MLATRLQWKPSGPLRVSSQGTHATVRLSKAGAERLRQSAGSGTCTEGGSGGRMWSREGLGFEPPAHAGRAGYSEVSALFSMEARRISINY